MNEVKSIICLYERTYRTHRRHTLVDGILIDGRQHDPNAITMQTDSPDPPPVTSASRHFPCGVSALVTKISLPRDILKGFHACSGAF
jgi:hypothetical protein